MLTCASHRGVCAKCYGRDLATGKMVELGLAVGVIAAQSIGEPGTQLTMRTFHIGGTARISEQSTIEARHAGTISYDNLQVVEVAEATPGVAPSTSLVVMNRTGAVVVQDAQGRDRERYSVIYGAQAEVPRGAARSSRTRCWWSGTPTPSRSSPRNSASSSSRTSSTA